MTAELVLARTAPALPRRLSDADMAWMAGVIDAKGSVVRKRNKSRVTPQVVLYVNAKDGRIARRLSQLTGTAPEPHARPAPGEFLRRGCAVHCEAPHVHVGEYPWQMPPTTRWAVTGTAAAVVLANLEPFMVTYRDYAADVDEVLGTFAAAGHGSGAVRSTLARLVSLGWQLPPEVTARVMAVREGENLEQM